MTFYQGILFFDHQGLCFVYPNVGPPKVIMTLTLKNSKNGHEVY